MGSSKSVLFPFKQVTGASMASTYYGPSQNVQFLDNVYFTINFTGTPTGTFGVQGSGDGGNNWQFIKLNTNPVASGAADTVGIEINQAPMPLLRVVYTAISGTGLMDIFCTAKEI